MKKYSYILMTFMIITNLNGSSSGWGAFAGGFFGSSLGNALSQPRAVVIQQPASVQREIIYQPANNYSGYIECTQRKKPSQRKRPETIAEEVENTDAVAWQAKAEAERARAERIKAESERIKYEIELEKLKNNNK